MPKVFILNGCSSLGYKIATQFIAEGYAVKTVDRKPLTPTQIAELYSPATLITTTTTATVETTSPNSSNSSVSIEYICSQDVCADYSDNDDDLAALLDDCDAFVYCAEMGVDVRLAYEMAMVSSSSAAAAAASPSPPPSSFSSSSPSSPASPSSSFFYERHVLRTIRMLRCAAAKAKGGTKGGDGSDGSGGGEKKKMKKKKKFVVIGSYLPHLALTLFPDLQLAEQENPRSRLLQELTAVSEGTHLGIDVCVLRLPPFVFGINGNGATSGEEKNNEDNGNSSIVGSIIINECPLWAMDLDWIKTCGGAQGQGFGLGFGGGGDGGVASLYVPSGSTAAVTVTQVAEAAVGAVERGQHGGRYLVNGRTIRYAEFYETYLSVFGFDSTPVVAAGPTASSLAPATDTLSDEEKVNGIHMAVSGALMGREATCDLLANSNVLGYGDDDVLAAMRESLEYVKELDEAGKIPSGLHIFSGACGHYF